MNFDSLYKIVVESNMHSTNLSDLLQKKQQHLKQLIRKFFELQHTNYSEKTYTDLDTFIHTEFEKYKQFCDENQEEIKSTPELNEIFDLFCRKYSTYFQ